jgi:hypothetical protein
MASQPFLNLRVFVGGVVVDDGVNRLAFFGKSPVLAMLAPKWALRVAAGGSVPPFPPRRAALLLLSGRDGKAGALTEPESCLDSRGECHLYLCALRHF